MHIKNGDEVVVISGNHAGQRGKIVSILKNSDRVLVEGVNLRVKNLRKTQSNPQGGTVEREMPLHISNIALWSDKAGRGVRTRIERSDGKSTRIGIPCGTKFD
ncbi:MAG TPA: 50S ribosomal protein L24 [Planctomycetes bacterium]|nr:50S ribosomal protein L24 [Planctomycetota bacterium]